MNVAFYDVEVRTATNTFELKEDAEYITYRHDSEVRYGMPLVLEKETTSVEYTVDHPELITLETYKGNSNYFRVKGEGDVKVHAEAYVGKSREKKTLEYTLHFVSKDRPKFTIKGNDDYVITHEGSIPKNKFTSLSLTYLRIGAKSAVTGEDLTDNIEILTNKEDYDLAKVGTYKIILKIVDPSNKDYNFLVLILNVTEHEETYREALGNEVEAKNYTAEIKQNPDKDNIYDKIVFNVDVVLKDSYDAVSGEIYCYFDFEVFRIGSGTYEHYSKDKQSVKVNKDRTSVHFTFTYESSKPLDISTFNDGGTPNVGVTGYVYTYADY